MNETLKPYRVLVTGSRDWKDQNMISRDLHGLWLEQENDRPFVVVHGDCPTGADAIARDWARARHSLYPMVTPEPHPACWRNGGSFDVTAGFRRNAEMVNLGADQCLAYFMPCAKPNCRKPKPHDSHGASHCVALAERAGIPTKYTRSWLILPAERTSR
jgi:hypothetical protein